jgi:hypothetical protein
MSERLTTLMHDTAGRVHPRLQPPEELRRRAERRRRARRRAVAAVVAAVIVIVTVMTNGLRTAQQTYWVPARQPDGVPAQQRDWVPTSGNFAVGDWEVTTEPTVMGGEAVTSGCEPAGTKCPGFYISVVVINRAEVPLEANSLVATGGYTDGSEKIWRAECSLPNLPNSARVPRYVQPGQEARLYCDNEGKPLESMDNVDFASVRLIED